jgi:hypothetical protein
MHIDQQIIRRLESGLTTIAIEFRRLRTIEANEAEPADVRIAIDAIGTEIQRMNYFLTELHNATHGKTTSCGKRISSRRKSPRAS